MVEIIEAGKNLGDFIRIPFILYSKDPLFVPQLNREMKVHFSSKNPFFHHARAKYFIALKDGRPAGRIISFVDERHNEFHKERTGFFGFFECVNDEEVSRQLFGAAEQYLKAEGMDSMRGPMSFSTNEECGFLFEGFDERPMIMMPYNPPYYNDFSEKYGLKKAKDLFAYIYEAGERLPEKVHRVAALTEKRGITVRSLKMKEFGAEMRIFREVYHSAWEKNWGFIPMTEDELEYAAGRLKQIIMPEMTIIAEKDGQPVGFMGIIPDFNFVLRYMKGKLNPLSLARALYYSKKIKDLRVMLLGIKREFRNRGVEALMFREGYKPILKGKYRRVEFSWILEDNIAVQRTIEMIGGELYKKYRIYQKSVV